MAPTPDVLPDDAVLLHIGPHKTGTTAMQAMLAAAREDLAAHGVTYPGSRNAHHPEVRALRQLPAGWKHDSAPLPGQDVWDALVQETRRTPGRVVISSEFFAQSDAHQRARVAADLGTDRLHVLIAARNPASMALSTWQQVLRDGKTGGLEHWLQDRYARPEPAPATSGFWSWADPATLVEAWSELLPLDRIRVVAIDDRDRQLLPGCFEQLLDLPAGLLSGREITQTNRSLTAPEAELLRHVVAATTDELSWSDFDAIVRHGMVRRLLQERRPAADEPRALLPRWAVDQADVEAAEIIRRLEGLGVSVIGDLAAVRRSPEAGEMPEMAAIPTEIAAEAVTGAVLGVQRLRQIDERRAAARPTAKPAGPRRKPAGRRTARTLEEVPTRELATALRARLRAGLARRLRPGKRR